MLDIHCPCPAEKSIIGTAGCWSRRDFGQINLTLRLANSGFRHRGEINCFEGDHMKLRNTYVCVQGAAILPTSKCELYSVFHLKIPQVDAIKAGFQQVLSLGALRLFNEMELEALLCGCGEKWEIESLKENIKFDHGYTASSLPLQHMLQIMCELGPDDQVSCAAPLVPRPCYLFMYRFLYDGPIASHAVHLYLNKPSN